MNSRQMDGLAISLSTTCMLHCLLLPMALALPPVASLGWAPTETAHRLLLCLAVPASSIALGMGCQQHQRRSVLYLGGIGLTLLLAATLFTSWWGEQGERLVTLLGGLTLTAAHLRNYHLCRRDDCACPHTH